MSNTQETYFLLNLRIGESLPGGITCTLNLGVSPSIKKVDGRSVVFQAINPPLHVQSIVAGNYNYFCTMNSCHIMIVLNGYQDTGEGCLKNFEARILLEDNWESGTATYSFLDGGEWTTISNQKVTAIENNGVNNLKKLAETVIAAEA